MVAKECNLRVGVYKVQTFGTTQFKQNAVNLLFLLYAKASIAL
jgi:hypothetical protein